MLPIPKEGYKDIYLAGGCFWGTEKYLASIQGVHETTVGYANGNTKSPTYQEVCTGKTGFTETVHVVYDPKVVGLDFLLNLYYDSIDPTSVNRQGNDIGEQYRTGIYYSDLADKTIIDKSIAQLQSQYQKPIAIEVAPIRNYYLAEEYHQDYLDKNPHGYCHISWNKINQAREAVPKPASEITPTYQRLTEEELKKKLTDVQYSVTQKNGTEAPYTNEYWQESKKGIYVDITTGEPLFSSTDKFFSDCGWPAFSKPIAPSLVKEKKDTSFGMVRTEVRSVTGDSHLGHVFEDGPPEQGGLRYCINSASLRFIPQENMEAEGYGYLLDLVK